MSSDRAEAIFENNLHAIHLRTSRMFFGLLIAQWIGAVVIALVWSPRTWIAQYWGVHQHVIAAALLGGLFAVYPLYLILRSPTTRYTRHMIAIGQMLQSALLVHVTGGRIETHFHVFGSLALLAFYRDWRVLMTATAVVYLDHLALGIWFPLSVYGVAAATYWRSLEHAVWVVFEVSFLGMSCHTGIRELRALAEREAALEEVNRTLENRVRERTRALEASQLRLAQVAKFESVGQLAAGVAHEVKNPLATLLIGIEHLIEHIPAANGNVSLLLQDMQRAVRKADSVIKGLLDFSAPEKLELALYDVTAVVEQALSLMQHELLKRHVIVVREFTVGLPRVRIDRIKLEQVLVNLFMNASYAMPSGGTLTVRTSVKYLRLPGLERERQAGNFTRLEGTVVAIEVEDTGCGIPAQALRKIFDPFFTTKPTGQGTGLGLTVSRKIIELHGGEIELANRPEGGIRATLLFSAESDRPAEAAVLNRSRDAGRKNI